MNITEAMNARHSVRQYQDSALAQSACARLQAEINACNRESGLHIQLIVDEPRAFDGFMAHYGKVQRRAKLYRHDRKERRRSG